MLYVVFKVWEWSEDYFVVTSERMLQASGVFVRKIAMMPLVKVTDMTFRRSTMGRILGYGTFARIRRARARRCPPSTMCPTQNSSTWKYAS